MNNEPPLQTMPDELTRNHLFDGVGGRPESALLFLIAAQNPDVTHYSVNLGRALTQKEEAARASERLYNPANAKRQCTNLYYEGFFSTPYIYWYSVNPTYLPYKMELAVRTLDIELSFPDTSFAEMLGGTNHSIPPRQAGSPSISLAIFRALLGSRDNTLPVGPELSGQIAVRADEKRIRHRADRLCQSGILQLVDKSMWLCRDMVDPVTELVTSMQELDANDRRPADLGPLAARAATILGNPENIRTLLSKATTKKPLGSRKATQKKPGTSVIRRPPATPALAPAPCKPPPDEPPPTIDISVPEGTITIPLGNYPPDWVNRAACSGENPDLFFIESSVSPRERVERIALAVPICLGCKVAGPCMASTLKADSSNSHDAEIISAGHTQAGREALPPKTRQAILDGVVIGPPKPKTQPKNQSNSGGRSF